MPRLALLLGLALLATACGPPERRGPAGTVVLDFSLAKGPRRNLKEPAVGIVYGSIFRTEDVSVTGPHKNAESVDDVELAIDLEANEPSLETFTSDPIPPGPYLFLGFFDTDGNGATDKDPDNGDPVTLATSNGFDIVSNEEVEAHVFFDLLF